MKFHPPLRSSLCASEASVMLWTGQVSVEELQENWRRRRSQVPEEIPLVVERLPGRRRPGQVTKKLVFLTQSAKPPT